MKFFPYKPRKYQKEIMEKIMESLEKKRNLIMEAPAGLGKTISSLVPCLSFASENDMGLIYLNRTNSQQKQAINELKKISEKMDLRAVSIQGRKNMCLLIENLDSLRTKNITNEEVAYICSARKKRSIEALRGKEEENTCIFFENFLRTDKKMGYDVISAEELLEYGREYEICAYELNKLIARKADVVIAPYIYIFDDFLREKFITWYSHPFKETILIIDEAHNLPNFCREILSSSISYKTMKLALREAKEFSVRDIDVINLIEIIIKIFEDIEKKIKFSENNDALLEENQMEEELEKNGMDIKFMEEVAKKMITYGEIIADFKESKNTLPRSFIRSAGNFFSQWSMLNEKWVKVIEKMENNIKIEAYCLDPSIASSILDSFYCSIHMSGTLQPLEEYRNSIGIDADMVIYPSPFPSQNRKIFYIDDVTTKYYMEEEMIEKIKSYIEEICSSVQKNTLILFPSYAIMERFLEKKFSLKNIYVERKGERQEKIMKKLDKFKNKGGIFLSVMGGRLSEGIDFPSEQLEIVIIVGIPYPPPSAKQYALQKYYDKKFGDGWKYAMEAQAIRKIMQSIGRLIRREDDRGVAIIMDKRAKRFRNYFKMERAKNIVYEVKKFFEVS
ncbi:MAG TPA: ATP-dependent DNA helicase [Thermoplasmatales archaeon]|nr:ATP-dependent DNA helicase [Thermoplasmatales archaeon]